MQLSSMRQIILPQKAIEQIQLRIIFVFILYSPCFIHSKGFPILVDAGGKQLSFQTHFYVQQRSILFGGGIAIVQLLMRLNQSLILSWSNESISLKSCGSFFYLYRKTIEIEIFPSLHNKQITYRFNNTATWSRRWRRNGKRPFDITITTTKQLFWC